MFQFEIQISPEKNSEYAADQCNKSFTIKDAMVRHRRTHTDERPYSCPHCPKKFTPNQNLQNHIHVHTKNAHFDVITATKHSVNVPI